jgi:hypothetical protein
MRFQARADQTSPKETWTVTAINATTFSVVGSISGNQDDATVDTDYNNGIVRFRIDDGGTAFEADDEFIFQTDASYPLEKIVLSDSNQNYGELEGVSFITGFSNTVENTVVDENADTHIVLRNINRTGFYDYCALILD